MIQCVVTSGIAPRNDVLPMAKSDMRHRHPSDSYIETKLEVVRQNFVMAEEPQARTQQWAIMYGEAARHKNASA